MGKGSPEIFFLIGSEGKSGNAFLSASPVRFVRKELSESCLTMGGARWKK